MPAVRTVCEYEQAPAPLDWVPKKITSTWLPGARLAGTVEECVTVDWATGDDKVPKELFVFDSPDGTMIFDSTEDNGQTTKGNVWGRPVGVAVAKDGALMVTDDGSGTVWRVAYTGKGRG
jgi:hypothetical protein